MSKNLSAKFYQENKERLQKKLVKDITIFLKKKKKNKLQHIPECYKNLSEDEKQKLNEYRKRYYRMRKNSIIIIFKNNGSESYFESINLLQKKFFKNCKKN